MKKFFANTVPIFWVLLLVDVVGTGAATYDYIKINQAQNVIIQNQVTGNQSVKDYINCLININPKTGLKAQEQACLKFVPKVTNK